MKSHFLVPLGIIALVIIGFAAVQMGSQLSASHVGTQASSTAPDAQAAQTHAEEYWTAFVKPDPATLQVKLSPLQFNVTQQDGTETPFHNEYWNNEQVGLYVDIVSGEPLFSSTDKYDSGTGWPSFTKPVDPKNIVLKDDYLLGYKRTEARSKLADSHLGHLFDDGPAPLHSRYCMNSAAMRFIPVDRLEAEGYGAYAGLFK